MIEPPLFEIETILGFSVRTTPAHWRLIQRKHPEVEDKIDEIKTCIAVPELIRRSKQDSAVYLFYRPMNEYYLAVVVKRLNGQGFLITSYVTDTIKEGELIWPISA